MKVNFESSSAPILILFVKSKIPADLLIVCDYLVAATAEFFNFCRETKRISPRKTIFGHVRISPFFCCYFYAFLCGFVFVLFEKWVSDSIFSGLFPSYDEKYLGPLKYPLTSSEPNCALVLLRNLKGWVSSVINIDLVAVDMIWQNGFGSTAMLERDCERSTDQRPL